MIWKQKKKVIKWQDKLCQVLTVYMSTVLETFLCRFVSHTSVTSAEEVVHWKEANEHGALSKKMWEDE